MDYVETMRQRMLENYQSPAFFKRALRDFDAQEDVLDAFYQAEVLADFLREKINHSEEGVTDVERFIYGV